MRPEDRLRQLRKDRGLSQTDIANMAHVAQRTIARYESGQRDMPDGMVELLAMKLDVSFDWLMGGNEK